MAENDVYTAFAGGFNRLRNYTENDTVLKEHTINLGYQTDMLAVYECCVFYLNPYRQGGGCSAAEALYKGLPALSINYGDVGVSVGKEFHVRDYDNMFDKVMAMVNDPLLFKRAIKMAKERGKLLTDTARPFINAMHMIERREAFE